MKIILKNLLTGLYCGEHVNWSDDIDEAMEFPSITAAALHGAKLKLESANVVLRYENPTCELTLPLEVCIAANGSSASHSKAKQATP